MILVSVLAAFSAPRTNCEQHPRSEHYDALQRKLAQGWNTWDVQSVTTHVLLPQGLAIRIGVQRRSTVSGDASLEDALIGRNGPDAERVIPGIHAWDGGYTDLRVAWRGIELRIQSAHAGNDLVLLATPLSHVPAGHLPATISFSVGYLWNKAGTVERLANSIVAKGQGAGVIIYSAGPEAHFSGIPSRGPYLAASSDAPAGISTGKPRTVAEIERLIEEQRRTYKKSTAGPNKEILDAIQSTLGWDTIFEPEQDRVVLVVSRLWSTSWGGYVIFE